MNTQSVNQVPGTALGGSLDSLSMLTTNPSRQYYTTQPQVTAAQQVGTPTTSPKQSAKIVWYIVGLFVALALLKAVTEHEKTDMELHHVRVSVFNLIVITALAGTGIVSAKIIANKYFPDGAFTKIVNNA